MASESDAKTYARRAVYWGVCSTPSCLAVLPLLPSSCRQGLDAGGQASTLILRGQGDKSHTEEQGSQVTPHCPSTVP